MRKLFALFFISASLNAAEMRQSLLHEKSYTPQQRARIKQILSNPVATLPYQKKYVVDKDTIKQAWEHDHIYPDHLIDSEYHRQVLFVTAVRDDDTALVTYLIDSVDPRCGPGLMYNVRSAPMMCLLLKNGFELVKKKCAKESLHFCDTDTLVKDPRIALVYLKAGADPAAVNSNGWTALMAHAFNFQPFHNIDQLCSLASILVKIGVPLEQGQDACGFHYGASYKKIIDARFKDWGENRKMLKQKLLAAIDQAKKESDAAQSAAQETVAKGIGVEPLQRLILGYVGQKFLPVPVQAELDALDTWEKLVKKPSTDTSRCVIS